MLLVVLDQKFLGKNVVVVLTVLVFPEEEFLGVLLGLGIWSFWWCCC